MSGAAKAAIAAAASFFSLLFLMKKLNMIPEVTQEASA
jgi:hypothetical protein